MAAHQYWRLYCTAGSSTITALSEVEFHATIGGADQTGSGTPSADSDTGGTYPASLAFDNNNATQWVSSATYPHWLKYDFGVSTPVDVVEYTMRPRTASATDVPTAWQLQWSDDGASWTLADARSGISWSAGTTKTMLVPSGYARAVLDDVATLGVFWRLGDTSGASASDSSGNARTGTYVNTPTLGVDSLNATDTADKSVSLSGVSHEYVISADGGGANNIAFELILKMSDYPVSDTAICFCASGYDYSSKDKILYIKSNGTLAFNVYDGAGKTATSSGTLPLNHSVHVVALCDGSNAKIYINGVNDGSVACGNGFAITSGRILLGGKPSGGGYAEITGNVDEFAAYSSLSEARIAAHYAQFTSVTAPGGSYPELIVPITRIFNPEIFR